MVAPFRAHCDILVLQHPHERRKYYSTTKLLTAAVTNSKILRGIEFSPAILPGQGQNCYLLYPGIGAADCSEAALTPSSTVVVIDGTWIEARKIVFRNKFLKSLPRLTFKNPIGSNYRIRKQPKHGCLSTLESVGHLLKLNAVAQGRADLVRSYDLLFDGFSRMIEQQLQHWPDRSNRLR